MNAYFHFWVDGHMHTHTNTVPGDGRPQPFRGQSSNSVVMRGQKEARGVAVVKFEGERKKQAVLFIFLVKSAVTVDLCWPSTSQEHHPRPF